MADPWFCQECNELFGVQTRMYCPNGHSFPLTVCEEIRREIIPPVSDELADLRRRNEILERVVAHARSARADAIFFSEELGHRATEARKEVVKLEGRVRRLERKLARLEPAPVLRLTKAESACLVH